MSTLPVRTESNKSGYRGIRWNARLRKWEAWITQDHRSQYLGVFVKPEDAARAYDAKARELRGARAQVNFPDASLLQKTADGAIQLPLTRGKYAIIDPEDYGTVSRYSWHASLLTGKWYVHAHISGTGKPGLSVFLHRLIMAAPKEMEVDHIDGDGLNCRKSNLRLATRHQNGANRRINSNNTSGYKGVSLVRANGKWSAGIMHNGRSINLGQFTDIEDAARAYDAAAREYFGEFAAVNFP